MSNLEQAARSLLARFNGGPQHIVDSIMLRSNSPEIVNLRAALDAESGRASATTVLPDGSAFFTASLPLPAGHWLYAPRREGWDSTRDCASDQPHPILTHEQRGAVVTAVRYAIRAATMCGKEMGFDPDALVQNTVVALCGPYGRPLAAAQEGSKNGS